MKVTKSYILCFVERSGSNLLCEKLHATKVAGRPHQYFWIEREQKWADKYGLNLEDYRAYVNGIMESSATKNGVFGMKASSWVLDSFADRARPSFAPDSSNSALLDQIFPDLRYLWLIRSDKLGQAISLARARQSRIWTSKQNESRISGNVEFDYEHIRRCRDDILAEETRNESFFVDHGIVPLRLNYEELVKDIETTISRVLDHLQIKQPIKEGALESSKLEKQADSLNEEWRSRFLEIEGRS